MRRIVDLAFPIAYLVLIPITILLLYVYESLDVIFFSVSLLAITVFIIALYLGILAYLKRFEPVDMRHFNLPYDEAIRRLDALLTGRGIQHTESALDEHWFGKEKKRAGIDLDILDLKDGPATMFELNGGARWILVSEVLSDGVRETAISLWPMIGDHVQFFERLKSDIDAGLKAGPS